MKIADAKLGDVLRDKDGDVWLVALGGLRVVTEKGHPVQHAEGQEDWSTADASDCDVWFGPFTRLVPESPCAGCGL